MPEATPNAPNPQGAQTPASHSSQAQESNGPKPVTLEDVQALINPIAAEVRRIKNGGEREKPEKTTEAERSYAERLKTVEAKTSKADRRLREAAISDAAREAGVEPSRMKAFKTLLEADYGSKLKLNDDDSVSYVDEFEQEKPLGELVSSFLKKPEGEMFRAPKLVVGARGLRGQGGQIMSARPAFHELPKAERDKLTPAERSAYVAQDMARGD